MIALALFLGLFSSTPEWHERDADEFSGRLILAWETLEPHLSEISETVDSWKSLPADYRLHWEDLAQLREYLGLLRRLSALGNENVAAHLQTHFRVLQYSQPALCTGYFTPVYPASPRKTERFSFPLYRPPENGNLLTLTREKLVSGALSGLDLELAWLDNALDNYLIHVQGSAHLSLPDGRTLRVGYAGSNGKTYSSLGKLLIRRGDIAEQDMSLSAIRKYYARHPEKLDDDLRRNERFIYFELSADVPRGKLGFPASAMHTLAVDTGQGFIHPPLLAVGLHTKPDSTPMVLGLVEDTGSAITGPARFDLYTGIGAEAELVAGNMIQRPEFFFLWPRNWSLPKWMASAFSSRRHGSNLK